MEHKQYVITTDNTTDLPEEYFIQNQVGLMRIAYAIDGVVYDGIEHKLTHQEFYDKIRQGAQPITQQINPQQAREVLEPYLRQGLDILHIAFTSGMSGTFSSVCMAREELLEEYPDSKMIVVDSLCASMGEGLLLHSALELKKQGKSLGEVAEWLEENKLCLFHDVVADDLFHLQRGGRVSKATAIMGTALGIKPRIYVNDEGKLTPYGKVRGKKAALVQMADRLAAHIKKQSNNIVFISHSDCLEDAQALQKLIKERTGIKDFMLHPIGPVIGSHTGVGTVALFYYAAGRKVD